MAERNKLVFFVFDEIEALTHIDSIKKQNNDVNADILLVCATNEIKSKLSSSEIKCKTIIEYSYDNSELQKAISWIQRWPDVPVLNGKSFKELLIYNGISIYWFLQTRFYLHRMKELLVLIERIKHVISIEKPSDILVIGNSEVSYIVSKLQNKTPDNDKPKPQSNIKYKSYQGFPTLKLLLLKLLRGTFVPSVNNKKQASKGNILVVTETSNWRTDFDFESQRYIQRDVFFHDIVRQLSDTGYDVTIIDFENRARRLLGAYSDNVKRQKSYGVPVKPWEKYVNLGIIQKSRQANSKIMEMWRDLQDSRDFIESLTYSEIPLYDIVRTDFEYLFKSLKAYAAVTLIEAADRILDAEKPQAILMHDEYGAIQLSLINAAKKRGIPTVSIQHGLISEEQIAYVHERSHVSGEKKEVLFPLPDKMCVWSESARQRLIEVGNFPASVPVITGDPKIDFLHKAIHSFNYEKITAGLGIPKGRKIILFATENLPLDEKTLVTKNVYNTMKAMPECFLIVKVHPNEQDISFYNRSANEIGLSELSVVKDINLYELLYVSDLVIVTFSTVGAEAMRMRKPVISLNLTRLHDNVPFIKKGMAMVVKNADDLLPSIKRCLDGDNNIDLDRAKRFAEEELGTIDGQATNRIMQVVLHAAESRSINKYAL